MDKNKTMPMQKRIALVAHDKKKMDLLEWVLFNEGSLSEHILYATGTTGSIIEKHTKLKIYKLQSGPLGGDLQIGAMITEKQLDILFFFWDPLEPQPHDPDIKALLRIAMVWNIPVACNRSTADFLISSSLFKSEYEPIVPEYMIFKQPRNN